MLRHSGHCVYQMIKTQVQQLAKQQLKFGQEATCGSQCTSEFRTSQHQQNVRHTISRTYHFAAGAADV